jgi:hypothetical protein
MLTAVSFSWCEEDATGKGVATAVGTGDADADVVVVIVVIGLVALVAVLLERDVGAELELKILELGAENSAVRVGADGDVELRDARPPFVYFLK